jgi:hypothetical protein
MGFYSDLFLRPKQAMEYSFQHPSLVRAVGFVILGVVAGILASLLLAGTILWKPVLSSLFIDAVRWLSGGLLLGIVGLLVRKISFDGQSLIRALTMLAHVNLYGFFLFLVAGIILPAVAIPEVVTATQQLMSGVIGPSEMNLVLSQSLLSNSPLNILVVPLLLIGLLFWSYGVYALYLAVSKYLNASVFKTIVVMIAMVVIQSVIVFAVLA